MKTNNGKRKINKNKLIILIGIIILLIIIVAGISVLTYKITHKTSEKDGEKESLNVEREAKDLFYNNFLIGYMLSDDVQTGDGELIIEGDPTVYYAVTDPLLKDIHTLEDLKNLIDDNVDDFTAVRINKLMNSEYANQYASNGKTLYVSKTTNGCSVSPFGVLDKSKIVYRNYEDNIYAVYDNVPYQVYYDANNDLKARALWFNCSEAISYTNTGAEDVYSPDNLPNDVQEALDNRVTDESNEGNVPEDNNENGEN